MNRSLPRGCVTCPQCGHPVKPTRGGGFRGFAFWFCVVGFFPWGLLLLLCKRHCKCPACGREFAAPGMRFV